jgi:hypothetical protein
MNEMQSNSLKNIKRQANEYADSIFGRGHIRTMKLDSLEYFISAWFEISPIDDDIEKFPYPTAHIYIYPDGSLRYPVHINHDIYDEDYIDFKTTIECQSARNKNIRKDDLYYE